jgi:hypothetical protein
MDVSDADFLLNRNWFGALEDVYYILGDLHDEDFWLLYQKRASYSHLVGMAFANCVTFPHPQTKISLNVIEEEEPAKSDASIIIREWAEYFKTIHEQAPEFEKDEIIEELQSEIESVQTILDNYRSNKKRHDKQIVNDYISSLKDLKVQKSKLEAEKKSNYDRWVEREFLKFKTNLS